MHIMFMSLLLALTVPTAVLCSGASMQMLYSYTPLQMNELRESCDMERQQREAGQREAQQLRSQLRDCQEQVRHTHNPTSHSAFVSFDCCCDL